MRKSLSCPMVTMGSTLTVLLSSSRLRMLGMSMWIRWSRLLYVKTCGEIDFQLGRAVHICVFIPELIQFRTSKGRKWFFSFTEL